VLSIARDRASLSHPSIDLNRLDDRHDHLRLNKPIIDPFLTEPRVYSDQLDVAKAMINAAFFLTPLRPDSSLPLFSNPSPWSSRYFCGTSQALDSDFILRSLKGTPLDRDDEGEQESTMTTDTLDIQLVCSFSASPEPITHPPYGQAIRDLQWPEQYLTKKGSILRLCATLARMRSELSPESKNSKKH
jgi:hypothetical protein